MKVLRASLLATALLSLCLLLFFTEDHAPTFLEPVRAGTTVNAVLGDASFVATFGQMPDAATDETLRLRTHLAYVERLLRARPVDHLPPALQAARARHLDHLHAYWTRGVFPRNEGPPGQRRPTFIDSEGRLCAVGYLIAQSAGRALAEQINAAHQLAYIKDMNLPALADWVAASGLTLHELAMIQPWYGGYPASEEDDPTPWVELALVGANGSMILVNSLDRLQAQPRLVTAGLGSVTGIAGLALGLRSDVEYRATTLALSSASLLLGGWNLLSLRSERRSNPEPRPTAQVMVLPTSNRTVRPVLAVRWQF